MSISREDVLHVAKLARLALSEEEISLFTVQLGDILNHAAAACALDTEGVPPTAHPVPIAHLLREDEPRPSLARGLVLEEAPAVEADRFRVPRILDET